MRCSKYGRHLCTSGSLAFLNMSSPCVFRYCSQRTNNYGCIIVVVIIIIIIIVIIIIIIIIIQSSIVFILSNFVFRLSKKTLP